MKLGNILFIHIPRTAGTHFEKLLGFKGHDTPPRCGNIDYGANRKEIMGWDKELKIMLQHATYSQLIKHQLIVAPEDLIKVSIIRNPYHRTVSLYKYFGGAKKWKSFSIFLDILKQKLQFRYFYLPQYKYLEHEGELAIDNIIRFENYFADATAFREKYKLDFEIRFNENKQAKKSALNFKEFYSKKEHLLRVENIYRTDFELFGYPIAKQPIKIITQL
ncbi:MAG: sulfotransferase family 2 domain-containing protein [Bacteroidota bacterium]